MRPWDDPKVASLLENHQEHVRVFCDDKAAIASLAKQYARRPKLDVVFVDIVGKVSFIVRSAPNDLVEFSPLISQDLCIARARTIAKAFEAELATLMESWGTTVEYAPYRPMILNWATQQLHQSSLIVETIEACNGLLGGSAKSIVVMEGRWHQCFAQILGDKPITLTSNPAGRQSTQLPVKKKVLAERSRILERMIGEAQLWYARKFAQSPKAVVARLRKALASPSIPTTAGLQSANVIVAFSARKKLHVDTIGPVVSRMLERGDGVRPLLLNIDPVPSNAESKGMGLENVPFAEACCMGVVLRQRAVMSNACALALKEVLSDPQKKSDLTAKGLPPAIVKLLLYRFFNNSFPIALGVFSALRAHFARFPRQILVTCTDSYWLTDVVRLAAERAGVPGVSIQNAYMARSPRYDPPQGNIITVIDTWSRDLMCGHFGCDPKAIWLVGTPRFDHIAKTCADGRIANKPSLNDLLPLDQGRKIVCFAAQDENLTVKTERVMQRLAEVRSENGPITVIIKLHPAATVEFEDALKASLARLSTPNSVVVVKQYDMQKLLRACDILVTVSSNVGVEAAILDKDIVIANLERRELSPPLDEFEIGVVACTDREFVSAVETILDDPRARADLAIQRQRYRQENAQLIAGTSAERIAAAIVTHFSGEGAGRLDPQSFKSGVA